MSRSVLFAVVVAALVLVGGPGQAAAAVKLRATIAQATPTPVAGGELSDDPGLPNGTDSGGDNEVTGGGNDDTSNTSKMPNTGSEALLIALFGLGLVSTGLGLRHRLADAGLSI